MTTISEGQTVVTPADNVFGAKQGQWTYEHYAHLLDDGQHYEIIDGVLLNDNLQKITEARVIGAPDLAIEISSPSTAIHDRHRKYVAYAQAGVKEYWIAEPKAHTIEVLLLEDGAYRSAGVFSGEQTLPSRVVPNFPVQVEQFFS